MDGPMMPAKCDECGSIFPSVNYKVRDSRFWSRDNEEVCPVCGNEHAKVADGLYDLTEKAIEIVAALAASGQIKELSRVHEISLQIANETIPPEKSLALIEETSSALAPIFRKAITLGNAALVVVGLAVSVASLSYQMSSRTDEILEDIYRKLDGVVIVEKSEQSEDSDSVKSRAKRKPDAKTGAERSSPKLNKKFTPKGDRLVKNRP